MRLSLRYEIFIITEDEKDIGFGHITRCLSLYQSFEEKNRDRVYCR